MPQLTPLLQLQLTTATTAIREKNEQLTQQMQVVQ